MKYYHGRWVDDELSDVDAHKVGETPYENGVGELTPETVQVPRPADENGVDPREAKSGGKDPRADKGKR